MSRIKGDSEQFSAGVSGLVKKKLDCHVDVNPKRGPRYLKY